MQARPRILHEAPASLSAVSAPVLSPPGRSSGGSRNPQPAEEGVGGWGSACPVSNLPGPQKFGQNPHPQAAHVGVIELSGFWRSTPETAARPPPTLESRSVSSREPPRALGGPQLRAPHPVLAPRSRSLRPAPRSLHPLQHPGCLLRDVRKPVSPLAPEPLAAPARCLPGTEPNRASGGGDG